MYEIMPKFVNTLKAKLNQGHGHQFIKAQLYLIDMLNSVTERHS